MPEGELIDDQVLHQAMEQTGGNAVKAAELLGETVTRVYNTLHKTPSLRARWTRSKENLKDPNAAAVAIYRPLDPTPASEAEAVTKADAMVRDGLAALGLEGEARETAFKIQKAAGGHIKSWMQLMAGGIVKQFLQIENDIEVINRRLEEAGGAEPTRPLDVKTESMLREDRSKLLELRIKLYDRAVKAQVNLALVNLRARGKNGASAEKARPAFTPLTAKS